mmetsp:Transcript_2201/g.6416  ORF Transcript_2201/g.6416 Transcript_2201/m.6416 type:complete len:294 (-) Transcript_2201:53-934(-)
MGFKMSFSPRALSRVISKSRWHTSKPSGVSHYNLLPQQYLVICAIGEGLLPVALTVRSYQRAREKRAGRQYSTGNNHSPRVGTPHFSTNRMNNKPPNTPASTCLLPPAPAGLLLLALLAPSRQRLLPEEDEEGRRRHQDRRQEGRHEEGRPKEGRRRRLTSQSICQEGGLQAQDVEACQLTEEGRGRGTSRCCVCSSDECMAQRQVLPQPASRPQQDQRPHEGGLQEARPRRHAFRRLFVTTLVNDGRVSIEKSHSAARHGSVAAQRTYMSRNKISEANRFKALGQLPPAKAD